MANIRNRVRIPPTPAEVGRIAENRELQLRRHEDNSAAFRDLAAKIDLHAASVEMIRPAVAALELSRSKLAALATVGFTVAIVAGWFVEAFFKWVFERVFSHFQ
jgi:uncharacterized protein involved in exopolysaccharide biosynthesis